MSTISDRQIRLGDGLASIPERLLLAHAKGDVLFIAGAGISQPAGLPDFKTLVVNVYSKLDTKVYAAIKKLPPEFCNKWEADVSGLIDRQAAEIYRFIQGDYDVVLGMLERRIDGQSHSNGKVRKAIGDELRKTGVKPASIHKQLMLLADRGGVVTIVTTNFDRLLEAAYRKATGSPAIQSYSLGGIPRPGRRPDFAGVLHIHGVLDPKESRASDLVVSDRDFGEFYLRRRVVPDFIYDAARLFNLVLVGYSANDPPMRYLLNAVAADGTRFEDFKERFTFVGTHAPHPTAMEDWKARGITPIEYDATNQHGALRDTLSRWASLSAINGKPHLVDSEVKRIVRKKRAEAKDEDRDLFDHLVRRGNSSERTRISSLASKFNADIGWLNAIETVLKEGASGVPK